jgi:hypothetical protein
MSARLARRAVAARSVWVPLLSLSLAGAPTILTACGGDATNPTEAPFPAVAGTYAVTGTYDGAPGQAFQGTLTLGQPSRESGGLTGSLTVTFAGSNGGASSGSLSGATVTRPGDLRFDVRASGSLGSTESWSLTGHVTGGSITGRYSVRRIVRWDVSVSTGSWSATRQ